MDSVIVSERDKKIIIWNFMEELCENHQNAVKNKLDTEFKFMNFHNIALLSRYLKKTGIEGLPDNIVANTWKNMETKPEILKLKITRSSLLKKDYSNVKNLNMNGIDSQEIDWSEVIDKKAYGIDDYDLGEVQEVQDNVIITQKCILDKDKFYLNKKNW